MAHDQQLNFLKEVLGIFPTDVKIKVLDLGSLDINGGIRSHVSNNWEYFGVDLELGPNVDIACPAQLLDLPTGSFDLCISSELFEHTPFWRETFAQMCRLTKDNGVVAFTCAGVGRIEHGTSRSDGGFSSPFTVKRGEEYYRNVPIKEASKAIAVKYWFKSYSFFDETVSKDLYFVGLRKSASTQETESFNNVLAKLRRNLPNKKYKIRWWTLKLLPFEVTDYGLRFTWLMKTKSQKWIKSPLYSIYANSGLRKFWHSLKTKLG